MKTELMEVFSDEVNCVILRTPGRNYPGVVVQGDTLRNLYRLADRIWSLSHNYSDECLREETDDLREKLRGIVIQYENTLKTHNIELPYPARNQVSASG